MSAAKIFTIRRDGWARNGHYGRSLLLNDLGARCCLGFYLKACGVPDDKMLDSAFPTTAKRGGAEIPKWLDFTTETNIAEINDNALGGGDEVMTDEEVEYAVRMAFAGYGIRVRFVGPRPNPSTVGRA